MQTNHFSVKNPPEYCVYEECFKLDYKVYGMFLNQLVLLQNSGADLLCVS